jgi:hypothetical protein
MSLLTAKAGVAERAMTRTVAVTMRRREVDMVVAPWCDD